MRGSRWVPGCRKGVGGSNGLLAGFKVKTCMKVTELLALLAAAREWREELTGR